MIKNLIIYTYTVVLYIACGFNKFPKFFRDHGCVGIFLTNVFYFTRIKLNQNNDHSV